MTVYRFVCVISSFFLPCGLLAAQGQTLRVDPAKSTVQFTLSDPLHAVHGTFHVQEGSITFNPQAESMAGTVVVDARSGNSGNGSRDKKMTQEELKAPTYSTVTFEPKKFSGALALSGDSAIVVDGALTLLGTPHPITVPMQVHFDGSACRATGSFLIPYVAWGLKDPSNFLLKVGKEVKIDLVLEGSLATSNLH